MIDPKLPSTADRAAEARAQRIELRYQLWKVTRSRSLRNCGRAVREKSTGVGVHVAGSGRAALTGLQSCSSIWSCPVCSAHIRQERASDIELGVTNWLGANEGHAVLMLTMTLRHRAGGSLSKSLDALMDAWRRTIRGAPWQRQKLALGIVGQVKAVEITHGENGWHPHLHLLVFLRHTPGDDGLAAFSDWLHDRWAKFLTSHARSFTPSRAHGVRVQRVNDGELGKYLVKVQDHAGTDRHVGMELARTDLKSGRRTGQRLPFEILADCAYGERADLDLWWQYEKATKGRRAIEWSRGLRELVGLGDERADEEITADDDQLSEDTLLGTLEMDEWRAVTAARAIGQLLAAAEADGWDGVLGVVRAARRRAGG